jgi:hypothetical protein
MDTPTGAGPLLPKHQMLDALGTLYEDDMLPFFSRPLYILWMYSTGCKFYIIYTFYLGISNTSKSRMVLEELMRFYF